MQLSNEEMEILNRAYEITSRYANAGEINEDAYSIFESIITSIIDGDQSKIGESLLKQLKERFVGDDLASNQSLQWKEAFDSVLFWNDELRTFEKGNLEISHRMRTDTGYCLITSTESRQKSVRVSMDFSIQVLNKIGIVRICDELYAISPTQICRLLEKIGKMGEMQPLLKPATADVSAFNKRTDFGMVYFLDDDEGKFVPAQLHIDSNPNTDLPLTIQIITLDDSGNPVKGITSNCQRMDLEYFGQYDTNGYLHYGVCGNELMLQPEQIDALRTFEWSL